MFAHWLTTAWRSLVANPLFSLIAIASLSVGCCGALLAGANLKQHLSFDRWVPGAERTLLLRERAQRAGVTDPKVSETWRPAAYDAVATFPGFESQTIVTGGIETVLRDDAGVERDRTDFYSVTSNYFDFFGIRFIEGASATAFGGKESVVVTESVARQVLGPPPWLGKTFIYDDVPNNIRATVTGVVRDLPFASHRRGGLFQQFDIDRPYFMNLRTRWDASLYGGHYVRVKRGVDVAGFQALLKEQIEQASEQGGRNDENRFVLSSLILPQIHMAGEQDTDISSNGDWTVLITLGSGALALLIVSAFNFVTLSLARSLRRRREVSVRKVLGAGQGSIVRHYLAESMLVTLISLAIGFALAELLHPWFARQLNQPEGLVHLYDPAFLGGSAIGGLVLALLVGAYPAFYLAHVRPRSGLDQGEAAGSGPIARAVSNGLLVLQIGAATALLAVALTMGAQAQYIASRPLGYSVADMSYIALGCPETSPGGPQPMFAPSGCQRLSLAPVQAIPGVAAATRAGVLALFSDRVQDRPVTRPGQAAELGAARFVASETDFLPLMEAKLLAGRLFDPASAFDRQLLDRGTTLATAQSGRLPVVVTRAFLPLVGAATPEEAIGALFAESKGAAGVAAFQIIGVVEDWHRRTLRYAVEPIVFTPGGAPMQIVMKYAPGAEPSVNAALQGPGIPNDIPIRRFDSTFTTAIDDDRRVMGAVSSFAGLAIIVAGLGVFALSAFEVRRRVREIGIRKALGAAPMAVARMVMSRNLRWAAIAAVLSWPFGWWLASSWLNGFVYRTDLGVAILPAAGGLVIVFVALAVSINALRAAAIRPDVALRAPT